MRFPIASLSIPIPTSDPPLPILFHLLCHHLCHQPHNANVSLPSGGPTAAVIAFKNPSIKVTVVDKDEVRIRRWNSRHLPIYEPGLGEMVRAARDGLPATASSPAHAPNLFFSADVARCISEADIVIIAVNTPTKSRGAGAGSATDMTAFEAVTAVVVQHARLGAIIVEKSTVPCRTAELVEDMVRRHFLVPARGFLHLAPFGFQPAPY